ncbi:F-box only protein 39-like [Odontesthes bonariensis]|uniref:F-box only protein 39-like n=1 Tax=Odontesthes bonariensis TaxID=219752 RepID=UPI003F58C72C
MQNREECNCEDDAFTNEDSEEEAFSDESSISDTESVWELLPDVCLRHVFRFLPDGARSKASLVCHQWHDVMRSPCLWRTRFFHFSGRLSKYKPSDYCSAVGYVSSLGVYLEKLEVCVCPPRTSATALRLKEAICGLLNELVRVKAPLQSFSLFKLEMDRSSWASVHRNSVVDSLVYLLESGATKLTTVCLNGLKNDLQQGLKLLSALLQYQKNLSLHCYILSLDLRGFFSATAPVHLNPNMPQILEQLQGLTYLGLSYSCLSDELLIALQQRKGGGRWNSGRDGSILQTFSLHCRRNELHQQLVHGSSWASLASRCPELNVKLTVEQVINTEWLRRILLPGIPLREYNMTAFYSPDDNCSAKPLLCDLLPLYRHSLQYLTLDLSNCRESLDDELLDLVQVCERLVDLRIWAFLEIFTVGRLLHFRMTKTMQLNKIKLRIYSINDNLEEQEDQLEEVLSPYLELFPPELEFFAKVCPYI